MHVINFFLLCVNTFVRAYFEWEKYEELLAVTVMYRHGARAPIAFYETDPYKDYRYWNTPLGGLTNVGKQQHYKLGKWLRQRYDGFLSEIYNKSEIYIRSSDYDRCLMSALSNLAGLYPPKGTDVWRFDLPWQPIPVHTVPRKEDDLIEPVESCKKYMLLATEILKSPSFKNFNNELEHIYKYMSLYVGQTVSDTMTIVGFIDALTTESFFNLELPVWASSIYPRLLSIQKTIYDSIAFTPETQRLHNGRFFNKIISQFSNFLGDSDQTSTEKFIVLSAHDINVYNVLKALKFKDLRMVSFAAAVIFELRKAKTGKAYVQILYKTTDSQKPERVQIEGCKLKCEISNFLSIVEPMSLTEAEFKEECSL